ncbi:protein HIDE1 [Sorex araneus]|uniref:protein HIDE1 n=1 Tax=Sorex araneus TaxID=42254 RepID=UPI0024337669|nr:protein HIDE1 [Sorex araneus]
MSWTVLLLAAGSLAIPAPSIVLVPPHPSSHEDPVHIACVAPGGFPGANFTLYRGGQVVQLLQAAADQFRVTFNLSGGGAEAPFQCQYGVLGEHAQPQVSDLSAPVHVTYPVPVWMLALVLSLVGGIVLVAGLVAVALVVRKVKMKNLQKKREHESCWAQINFTNTDMTFDNSLFTVSAKMASDEDALPGSTVTPGDSGPRRRPTSTSSSPEPPEFSTFRNCQ